MVVASIETQGVLGGLVQYGSREEFTKSRTPSNIHTLTSPFEKTLLRGHLILIIVYPFLLDYRSIDPDLSLWSWHGLRAKGAFPRLLQCMRERDENRNTEPK